MGERQMFPVQTKQMRKSADASKVRSKLIPSLSRRWRPPAVPSSPGSPSGCPYRTARESAPTCLAPTTMAVMDGGAMNGQLDRSLREQEHRLRQAITVLSGAL